MMFVVNNKRDPSRHRIEEHNKLNCLKANRKLMNAGELKINRLEKFKELFALAEKNKHLNQYK